MKNQSFTSGPFTFRPAFTRESLFLSAAIDDVNAIRTLAEAYEKGNAQLEIELNYSEARKYYQKLANLDFLPALYKVAVMHNKEGNRKNAIKVLKKVAKKEYVPAYGYLSQLLLDEFLEMCFAKNAYNHKLLHNLKTYLKKAYDKDPHFVQLFDKKFKLIPFVKILFEYAQEHVKQKKLIIALDLFTQAEFIASLCGLDGQQLKSRANQERQEVSKVLYHKAKEGDPESQYDLAYCLERGIGYKLNLELAKKWYQAAVSRDFPGAKGALENIDKNITKNTGTDKKPSHSHSL